MDRVLNILAEQKFVDGALTKTMKLTPAGFLEAEKTIAPAPASPTPQPTTEQHEDATEDEVALDLPESKTIPLKARPEDKTLLSGEIRPVSPEQFAPSREALEKFIEEWSSFYPTDDTPEDPGNKTELPISREAYDLVLALAESTLALHKAPGLPLETRGLFDKTLEALKSLRETLEAAEGAVDKFKAVIGAIGTAIRVLESLIRLFFS